MEQVSPHVFIDPDFGAWTVKLFSINPCEAEGAVVKRVRKTNVEAEFLVEPDNPDKKAHPTTIWNRGAPEEGQAYSMIGRVIWSWTRFP